MRSPATLIAIRQTRRAALQVPVLRWLAGLSLGGLSLAIGGCVGATGGQLSAATSDRAHAVDAANAISEIGLERDCFGCETGSRLVLHRDGRAELTITGKPRRGTADRHLHGRVSTQDFDALARLALAHRFFGLEPIHEAPDLQDGAWATTSVTRAGERKEVFRREDAGPPGLHRLEAAIEAVQARTRFAEAPAGR